MKRALLFLFISLALLYVVREVEYAGVRRIGKGEFGKLKTTFLDSNNYNVLIIGSSRAECQFYCPVLDSVTGLHFFNAGMTGATMPFIRTTLEAYLVHSKTPEYVILNLDLHSLSDSPDTVNLFPRYFPYLSNKKLYDGLQERDHRFVFFRWLPFYSMPYFGTRYLDAAIHGWTGKSTKYDEGYHDGFAPSVPDPGFISGDSLAFKNYASHPQPYFLQNLDSIERICSSVHAKLVLVISPLYFKKQQSLLNYDSLVKMSSGYAKQHDNLFVDFSSDSARYNRSFYNNAAHMNPAGARVFSLRFARSFAQYLRP